MSTKHWVYLVIWQGFLLMWVAARNEPDTPDFGEFAFSSALSVLMLAFWVEIFAWLFRCAFRRKQGKKNEITPPAKIDAGLDRDAIDKVEHLARSGALPGVHVSEKRDHPDQDEDEDLSTSSDAIETDALTFTIEYSDAQGRGTQRTITAQEIDDHYIRAFCHMRGESRTFRVDRILNVITEDGEVLPPQAYFRQSGFQKSLRSGDREVSEVVQDHLRPALGVLVALAKAEGGMCPEELDEICAYVDEELAAMSLALEEEDRDELRGRIRRMRPAASSIVSYLKRMSSWSNEERGAFFKAAKRVAAADGEVQVEEALVLGEIKGILETLK